MITRIVVCGAGTMGAGIAQCAAQAGFNTLLFDVNQTIVNKANDSINQSLNTLLSKGKITSEQHNTIVSKITYTSQIADCVGDLIIEAIIEKIEIKKQLFNELAIINSNQTILASNTSSLSITQIASGIPFPGRVVGMHFFNPATIMKLVEVISGASTEPTVAIATKQIAEQMGKKVVMAADSPGFIVNRVARHFYVEHLMLAEENVAPIAILDELAVNAGFKMGAFTLMDLIGNDINYSVTESLFNAFHFDSKFRPNRIQQQKVLAGHLGKKTGKGFYEYF